MCTIMVNHKVNGLDIMCRRCGNAESPTTPYLNHFRLEGTGKDSTTLRCLNCQTVLSLPLSQLGSLFYSQPKGTA